jgi:hypothetical protein
MIDERKLYVWLGVLRKYTDGVAISIARTKEEAIELLLIEYDKASEERRKIKPYAPRDQMSDFGTSYAKKSEFRDELLKNEPIVRDVGISIAFFQGGGS